MPKARPVAKQNLSPIKCAANTLTVTSPTPSNGTTEASYGTCEYPWSMGAQETMEAT